MGHTSPSEPARACQPALFEFVSGAFVVARDAPAPLRTAGAPFTTRDPPCSLLLEAGVRERAASVTASVQAAPATWAADVQQPACNHCSNAQHTAAVKQCWGLGASDVTALHGQPSAPPCSLPAAGQPPAPPFSLPAASWATCAAADAPAILPNTTHSSRELPTRRFLPCSPPACRSMGAQQGPGEHGSLSTPTPFLATATAGQQQQQCLRVVTL